jgi:hypothetical protein
VRVSSGGSQTFSIIPDPGYHIADVTVDSASIGAVPSYSFTAVNANHTIAATFAVNTSTITSQAGSGGSITPSGSTQVNAGASQTFAIMPDNGFRIANVMVDGISQGDINSYTITNVTSEHAIAASFASLPNSIALTLDAPTGGGPFYTDPT